VSLAEGIPTRRSLAATGEASAAHKWAWVELNYRPHAYQAHFMALVHASLR